MILCMHTQWCGLSLAIHQAMAHDFLQVIQGRELQLILREHIRWDISSIQTLQVPSNTMQAKIILLHDFLVKITSKYTMKCPPNSNLSHQLDLAFYYHKHTTVVFCALYLCCCRVLAGPAGAGACCWSGGLSERRGWILSERIREQGVILLLRGKAEVEEEGWRTAVGVF